MRTFFFTISLISCTLLFSQRIENFNVLQANGIVSARFTLKTGPSCDGWTLMHGTDSLNMVSVYDYPSVCGISAQDESHSTTHATPLLNQINYYRILLNYSVEQSPARAIYVGKNSSSIFVSPNPVYDAIVPVKGRVMGGANLRMQGMLLDQTGVIKEYLDVNVVEGQFDLNVSGLVNGFYVLWLTDGVQLFPGKFIVYR